MILVRTTQAGFWVETSLRVHLHRGQKNPKFHFISCGIRCRQCPEPAPTPLASGAAAHLLLATLRGHSPLTCPEKPLGEPPRDTALQVWERWVCIAAGMLLGGALPACLETH